MSWSVESRNLIWDIHWNHANVLCIYILVCSVVHSWPTLCKPWTVTCQTSPSVEFSKQEILEWVAISFSRGSSVPRSPICISWVSCISRQILYHLYHLGRHFHYLHSLKKNLPPLSLFHVLYYLSFWIAKRWAECNLVQVFRILHPPPKKKSWIHHLCTFTVLKF